MVALKPGTVVRLFVIFKQIYGTENKYDFLTNKSVAGIVITSANVGIGVLCNQKVNLDLCQYRGKPWRVGRDALYSHDN